MVDDSPLVRAILAGDLADQGHSVVEASDGEQALRLCRTDPPDVLLLDIVMPGMSGLEVLDAIQADPALRHIPVVCLTGRSETDDVVEALGRGAHDYLRKPFEPSELNARLASALRVKRLTDELRVRNSELEVVSRTDALTRLPNRGDIEQTLNASLERLPPGQLLSVLMIDIDHFKDVNDTYGHPVGDAALRHVGGRLRHCLRAGDTVGRWGGEEFLAILPMANAADARHLAERLCRDIAHEPVRIDELELDVTVSIGIGTACGAASGTETAPTTTTGTANALGHTLLIVADQALYQAKREGRACVRSANENA